MPAYTGCHGKWPLNEHRRVHKVHRNHNATCKIIITTQSQVLTVFGQTYQKQLEYSNNKHTEYAHCPLTAFLQDLSTGEFAMYHTI